MTPQCFLFWDLSTAFWEDLYFGIKHQTPIQYIVTFLLLMILYQIEQVDSFIIIDDVVICEWNKNNISDLKKV